MERNLDINTVLPSSVQMTNTQETMLSRRGNKKREKPENRTPQSFPSAHEVLLKFKHILCL